MTTSVSVLLISIRLLDYWHVGSGAGAAFDLDAVVDKDHEGLPRVRGRMLKGLLRDAVYKAENWGLLAKLAPVPGAFSVTEQLFGLGGFDKENVPRDDTTKGALRVDDGQLPAADRSALTYGRGALAYEALLRRQLYREVFNTAIEHASGTARSHTLRGIEVVIPLELEATIHWTDDEDTSPLARGWPAIIEHSLPLIRSVGAHRSRGLGRAFLSVPRPPSRAAGPGAES